MLSYRRLLLALAALAALAPAAAAQAKPRLDPAGDPLPEGALARLGSVRFRHDSHITCLSFSPDGKTVVTGGNSKALVWWDAVTGKETRRLTVNPMSVVSLQFSADGKVLAVGGNDGTVRILDGGTGTERRSIQEAMRRSYGMASAVLSPDGRSLLMNVQYGGAMVLYDVATGKERARFAGRNRGYVYGAGLPAAFTPDSKGFVTSSPDDGKLHLYDSETGKSVRVLEGSANPGARGGPRGGPRVGGFRGKVAYYSNIMAVAIDPDGRRVAFSSGGNQYIALLDLGTGKEVQKLQRTPGYYAQARALAFFPNGRFLAEAGGQQTVNIWGLASGKQLRSLEAPAGSFQTLSLSRDGKKIAAAAGNALYVWDVATGRLAGPELGHQSGITGLALSRDGKRLVSTGASTMRAWDVDAGKELQRCQPNNLGYRAYRYGRVGMWNGNMMGSSNYLRMSADGKTVSYQGADTAKYRWQLGAGREPEQVSPPHNVMGNYSVTAVSPDGKTLAGMSWQDRKIRLVDLTGKAKDKELFTLDMNYYQCGLTFSPDGRRLAVGTHDRNVRLFDVATGSLMRTLGPPAPMAGYFYAIPRVEFSADSRAMLKIDTNEGTECYEVAGGALRFKLAAARPGLQQVCWSPDGRLLAWSQSDGVVVIHDSFTGKELCRRDGKQGFVQALAFCGDSRRLASGGSNTTVLVWELPNLPAVAKLTPAEADALWADLAGDGEKAYKAVGRLSIAPEDTVRMLKERLKPPPPVDAKKIAQLVADLDSDSFEDREKAEEALSGMLVAAQDELRRVLKTTRSAEQRKRIEGLLKHLKPDAVAPERLRLLRAVEALERCQTAAATDLLRSLAKIKLDPLLERDVKASLERAAPDPTKK
jgi:WD40 repeat protein